MCFERLNGKCRIEEPINTDLLNKLIGNNDSEQKSNQDTQPLHGIRTEIEVLDKLLGYDEFERPDIRIEPGSIFLIRGEPGAGKTTLGLQILSQNLERTKSDTDTKYVFFSLEREPSEVLEYTKTGYGFFRSEDLQAEDGRILKLGTEVMEYLVQWLYAKTHSTEQGDFISKFEKALEELKDGNWRWPAISLAASLVKNLVSSTSRRKLDDHIRQLARGSSRYPIVFIDSLNVLVHLLQRNLSGDSNRARIPERLLLNAICTSIREVFRGSVVIFTGEYHYQDMSKQSAVSESFFCDIEMSLFSEPVVVTSDYDSKFESPLGSNILSLMGPNVKSIQTQSFCRVLKSRRTPNQSRRCVYDIVSNSGVEFYETYPGDGHLILFAENAQQRKIWSEFFDKDMPLLYPALRYDSFDKSSLQRTSAAQRRFRYVPPRVDMTLTSFDNYWINWYSELCFKSNVADTLQKELGIESFDKHPKLMPILNDICFDLSSGQAIDVFPEKIRPKVDEFFKLIHDGIKEVSKDESDDPINVKNWPRQLLDNDTLNDYISGLFKALTSIDPQKEGGIEALDINRPCLQCLWCRRLIKRLYRNLKSEQLKNTLINKCNSCLNQKKEDLPISAKTTNLSYEDKLSEIIENTMSSCLECNPEKCAGKRQEPITDEKSLMRFLDVPDAPCQWREKLSYHIWEFILCHLLNTTDSISDKNEDKSDSQSHVDETNEQVLEHLQDLVSELMPKLGGEDAKTEYKSRIIGKLSHKLGDKVAAFLGDQLVSDDAWCKLRDIGDEIRDSVFEKGFLSDEILKQWKEVPFNSGSNGDEQHDQWLIILARLFYDVIQGPVHYRLITAIPCNKLRLFGERKSNIISELEDHKLDFKRPIHRPERLFSLRDQNTYCSIPYDANISFLAFRRDILDPFYDELRKNKSKKQGYIKTIQKLIEAQEKALEQISDSYNSKYSSGEFETKVSTLVEDSLKNRCPPKTWEEIIAYYLLNQQNKGPEHHFLIETRTQDTLLATMLEFVWSCGINLQITNNYTIENRKDTLIGLTRAFYLIALMFQNKIIPANSTLEVQEFSRLYGHPKEEKLHSHKEEVDPKRPDWIFARHWYSTLIEILSEPKAVFKNSNEQNPGFLWEHNGAKLDIMPIPVSFSNYATDPKNTCHISCWGDWHLAMISGTENMELGVDLINNLMSSDRVCERAFANAAIPTVEAFYKQYGDSRCFNLPERKDIVLPNWSYNRLRRTFFTHAKSRSQVFDYHHCMREFHSVLEYVHSIGQPTRDQNMEYSLDEDVLCEIYKKLDKIIKEIPKFRNEKFLLA